jgi:hypothetical protein
MRIFIEPSLHPRKSMLPREIQDDIHALRLFASELIKAGDLASVEIVLAFADLLEGGANWEMFLDDVSIVGMYRQAAPKLTCIQ